MGHLDGVPGKRRRFAVLLGGICIAAAAFLLAACGGNGGSPPGDDTEGDSGGEKQAKVAFIFAGPLDDGGFNNSMVAVADHIAQEFPEVEVSKTPNIPFTDRATRVVEQLVAGGANMIVDAAGIGDQINTICEANPDLACLVAYPQEGLPDNVTGWTYDWWTQEYVQGVSAGLMMNEMDNPSNSIGYVQAYEIPLTQAVVNLHLLGCQSVNPDCTIRMININNYYDPPTSTQAAETLADAGVDILNTWVNDTSVCQTAERRGLPTFGHFFDYTPSCPESMIRAAVQQAQAPWFVEQVQALLDGNWQVGINAIGLAKNAVAKL